MSALRNCPRTLPESVVQFIQTCSIKGLRLVMYGSGVTDWFTDQTPNDYDFFVLGSKSQFIKDIADPAGIHLEKYGDYIAPVKDVYFFFDNENLKIDLIFLSEKATIDQVCKTLEVRGALTINSMLYDVCSDTIIDRFSAFTDLDARTLKFHNLDNILTASHAVKPLTTYLSYLHGKYPTFKIASDQIQQIKKYLSDDENYHYFNEYYWRSITSIARIFSYSEEGIANVYHYWQEADITKRYLPGIDEGHVKKIMLDKTMPIPNQIQITGFKD